MHLRSLLLIALALPLGACGGTFNQGADPDDDDDDGGEDSGEATDGGDGGGDGADGGGTDGTEPVVCTSAWHPIHETGWSKTFSATYSGNTGTATEEGLGPVDGQEGVYLYRDSITTSADSYSMEVVSGCDYDGEGMFLLSWGGDFTMTVFGIIPMGGEVTAELSPHRKYLPPEYAIGSSGSWSYSYSSNMTWQFEADTGAQPASMQFDGVYSELGFESYTLPNGETVQAYRLINEYTSSGDLFGAPIPQEGYIEQWWVKGLGMVKEVSYDNADTSTPLMTKTLTDFSGLTPE